MSPGAGASGAIFGLAGALIAALYLGHLPIPKEAVRSVLKSLLAFAGYNLFFGAVSKMIDNSAHIGGLVTGLALGAFLARHLMAPPEVRSKWRAGAFVLSAVLLVALFGRVKRANAYVVPLDAGMKAFQKGNFDEAARALEDADRKKPNDHATLFWLASAYLQQQDYTRAESTLQRVVRIDPGDADAQFNLGLAKKKLGKYDEAIVSLTKAAQLSPKDPDAEEALSEAYAARNMPEQAQAAFQRSVELRKAAKP